MIKMTPLPKDAALTPVYKGFVFLGFFKIKVKDIKKTFDNSDKEYKDVNGKDTNYRPPNRETVNKVSKCITENPTTWDTKYFEPPVISENGELILGRHRVDGHEQAGETFIIVAMGKFISFEGKSPLYWLRCAQGKENNTPIIKNEASDKDTIRNVLTQIEEKTIKKTLEDIETSLKDQGIGHGKKRQSLIKQILLKLKVKSNVDMPHNYTALRKKEYLKEKYPNNKLSTISVFNLSKKPKNIYINDDNIIHIAGLYSGNKKDRYPILNPFSLLALSALYPESQILFSYSVTAEHVNQVKKIRKFVPSNYKNFENMILKMADHIRSKSYKKPKQIALPQLKEELNLPQLKEDKN